jgi:alpha-beta hydrolase superfamily lysophospholipase
MRSAGRLLGRVLLGFALLAGLFWLLPRETIEIPATPRQVDDPAARLAAREAAHDDIRPGAAARIRWAGAPGAPTGTVLLYLHGFSASAEEIRPVPDDVADALGANLVFARLAGHGRDGAAMAQPRAGDWIADTALFLAVARAVGDRVLVMGTSTGGTLAAWAMTEPDMAADVAGVILVSPNFALADPLGRLLEWPLARAWVPRVAGAERGFEPLNAGHAAHWTTAYPTVAAVSLGTLLREMRGRELGAARQPALVLFSDDDRVVSADATRAAAARWGGPVTLAPLSLPAEGADPLHHVIAGDILSPAMTAPVTRIILDWVAELPG